MPNLNPVQIRSVIGDGFRYEKTPKALQEHFDLLKPGSVTRIVLLNKTDGTKYQYCTLCKFEDGQCFYWLHGHNDKLCDAKVTELRRELHTNE